MILDKTAVQQDIAIHRYEVRRGRVKNPEVPQASQAKAAVLLGDQPETRNLAFELGEDRLGRLEMTVFKDQGLHRRNRLLGDGPQNHPKSPGITIGRNVQTDLHRRAGAWKWDGGFRSLGSSSRRARSGSAFQVSRRRRRSRPREQ